MDKILQHFIDIIDEMNTMMNQQRTEIRQLENELKQAKTKRKPGRPSTQLDLEDDGDDQ